MKEERVPLKKNVVRPLRPFLSYLALGVKGFCIGSADVVPGVSGGTMAFILGIYEELIRSIRSFDLEFLRLLFSGKVKQAVDHVAWRFLASMGLGVLTAIFSLSRLLSWLLHNQPVLIWSFFFGLILGSVFMVGRHLGTWRMSIGLVIFLGAAIAFFLVGMVPVSTPETPWFLFLCGVVAICAMILPGISGAFILVLLGKYHYVLDAVNNRNIWVLFLVAAGAGLGLITFARFLDWLFKKHHDKTIAVLTGLMIGSLRKVWPWKETLQSLGNGHGGLIPIKQANILPPHMNIEVIVALCLMAAGLITVIILEKSQTAEDDLLPAGPEGETEA